MTKINPTTVEGSLATKNSSMNFNQTSSSYSGLTHVLSKVNHFALPIVLAGVAINLPYAEAGPVTYAGCVAACEALATVSTGGPGAAFIMQCIQGCYPILFVPWCP